MALFSRSKKKTEDTKAKAEAAPVVVPAGVAEVSHVLLSPRITEKATLMHLMDAYVFDVAPSANKKQVEAAIRAAYKVTPRMVRLVTIRAKSVRNIRTGKRGVKQGGKKAYVYLKKGETITIA